MTGKTALSLRWTQARWRIALTVMLTPGSGTIVNSLTVAVKLVGMPVPAFSALSGEAIALESKMEAFVGFPILGRPARSG